MNDRDRRRYEAFVRVNQFGIDNAGDFTGIATTKFNELGMKLADAEIAASGQQSGFGEAAQQFEIKDTARENLRDDMSTISRTAKSMEYAIDGISDKFAFQRNMPDVEMLAKARAFVDDIVTYKVDFIAYGMPATFDVALNTAANAFEATFAPVDSATAEHIAGTAATGALIREGMVIIRILDGIAKNVYATNAGQFAAWSAAAHVQRDPKPKPPHLPPTP
jgi:hypothetical protein